MSHGIPKLTKPTGKRAAKKQAQAQLIYAVIEYFATESGWDYLGWSRGGGVMHFYRRIHDEEINCRIWIKLRDGYKVATRLWHPRGFTRTLIREGVDLKTVRDIFENPRVHTGHGKYKRTGMTK